MLLLAGLGGSIDFYLMRVFIFIGIIYLSNNLVKKHKIESGKEALYFYGYIFIAILFNPIIPVYLYDRGKWVFIDVLVILFIISQNYFINKNQIANKKQKSFLEEYDSLLPGRKKEYLDERLGFDRWNSNNSWLDIDIDQITRDAVRDVLIDLDYNSCINYDPRNSMISDNQHSDICTSENEEITAETEIGVEKENEAHIGFYIGDMLYDNEWGKGILLSVKKNENGDNELVISFNTIGLKRLLISEFHRRNNIS